MVFPQDFLARWRTDKARASTAAPDVLPKEATFKEALYTVPYTTDLAVSHAHVSPRWNLSGTLIPRSMTPKKLVFSLPSKR